MASASTRVHVIFHPKWGPDFQCVFHVPGIVLDPADAGIAAILAAINACTCAVAIEIALSVVRDVVSSATSGAGYISADKAFFPAIDGDGSAHNFKVPGLKATILLPNNEGIDFTLSDVLAYQTALTTYALSPGGVAVTHLLYGRRTENRKPLKTAGTIVI